MNGSAFNTTTKKSTAHDELEKSFQPISFCNNGQKHPQPPPPPFSSQYQPDFHSDASSLARAIDDDNQQTTTQIT